MTKTIYETEISNEDRRTLIIDAIYDVIERYRHPHNQYFMKATSCAICQIYCAHCRNCLHSFVREGINSSCMDQPTLSFIDDAFEACSIEWRYPVEYSTPKQGCVPNSVKQAFTARIAVLLQVINVLQVLPAERFKLESVLNTKFPEIISILFGD